jgi:DNA-binding transcriptional MerR regulator
MVQNYTKEAFEDLAEGYISYDKIFDVEAAGINQKIFGYWKSKGLLGFIKKDKWARLSFSDVIWLRTLETMRKFGCSIKNMKSIYDHYFERALNDNLVEKNIQAQIDELETGFKDNISLEEREVIKVQVNTLKMMLKHPNIKKNLSNGGYFTELIMKCLSYKLETGIIIFEDGSFEDYSISLEINDKRKEVILTHIPRLIIPISHLITEFVSRTVDLKISNLSVLFDEDELRVIKEMRNENVKSITIKFREKDHKVETIKCDKSGIIKGDEAKKIMNILGLKNYQGIELNTRDGKTLSFNHTEKKFF